MGKGNDDALAKLRAAAGKSGAKSDMLAALRWEPHPNPLENVKDHFTGDLEHDAATEVETLHQAVTDPGEGLSGAALAWRKKHRSNSNTSYWFAVCFPDEETKLKFLREVGWEHLGPNYLHGPRAAQILGIDLPGAEDP